MHNDESRVDRVWFGHGAGARLARTALSPLELLYRAGVHARGVMFNRGVLSTQEPPIPAVSVGNLSVGGTGKTPVSAWVAAQLLARGARPAIVMRGYGGDEPLVHARLNPGVPVFTDPNRLAGASKAAAEGADCVVLDDAFQHRSIARVADLVLVSADRWDGRVRLLPAGPWREPLTALKRATVVVVTRKAVDLSTASSVASELVRRTKAQVSIVSLALDRIASPGGSVPVSALRGRPVLAIAAVGDSAAFSRQLEQAGAVVRTAFFEDHHRFTKGDAERLARDLGQGELAVCTLKDYVKLEPLWPAAATSFCYVSQRVAPEAGELELTNVLDRVLRTRTHHH